MTTTETINFTSDIDSAPSIVNDGRCALPNIIAVPLLLAGPALTAWLLIANRTRSVLATHGSLNIALICLVVLLWSPMFISLPTALLQFARDRALPRLGASSTFSPMNLVRGVVLVPYLIVAPSSKVRLAMTASLAGWALGIVVALPYLHGLTLGHVGF